jgi:hypothetical protein
MSSSRLAELCRLVDSNQLIHATNATFTAATAERLTISPTIPIAGPMRMWLRVSSGR